MNLWSRAFPINAAHLLLLI